jgi:hypothetical protein
MTRLEDGDMPVIALADISMQARQIALQWGWDASELFAYLREGGTRNEILNASAMQAAHEIIRLANSQVA